MRNDASEPSEAKDDVTLRLSQTRVEWRAVEGEIVALDLMDSTYFTVNHAGGVLWSELTSGTTRDRLVAALANRFAVDPGTAGRDVDAFIDSLDARGLLTHA